MNLKKEIQYWMVVLTLILAMQACTPQAAPGSEASVSMAFEVEYETTWLCGDDWRVSFKVHNQGNAPIESVFYSVTESLGFINYGMVNNAPFERTTTESEPDCAQPIGHGQSSLAPGEEMTVPITLNPIPDGFTKGLLYIEACSENNRGGVCETRTLEFTSN